jgi:hypothetical protein
VNDTHTPLFAMGSREPPQPSLESTYRPLNGLMDTRAQDDTRFTALPSRGVSGSPTTTSILPGLIRGPPLLEGPSTRAAPRMPTGTMGACVRRLRRAAPVLSAPMQPGLVPIKPVAQ